MVFWSILEIFVMVFGWSILQIFVMILVGVSCKYLSECFVGFFCAAQLFVGMFIIGKVCSYAFQEYLENICQGVL